MLVAACGGGHGAPPAHRDISAFAGAAQRVAVGDLDGDGRAELVFADPTRLWVTTADGRELASTAAPGGIQVLEIADGKLYAGWGQSREHEDAAARIDVYQLDGAVLSDQVVLAPATERAEIVAIVPGAPLVIAWYASKYMVTSARATPAAGGTWAVDPIATIRMATSYARGADGDLVVGRVYGDSIEQPGDAFVLAPDGSRTAIPTTRGVHGLAVAPDGALWLGDGWDRDYGHNAHALLTRCVGTACAMIEDVPGNYAIESIAVADLDGDGKPEVIARGNAAVRVYQGSGSSWTGATVAGAVRDVAVGDVDGDHAAELVVVGDKSEIIRLR